MRKFIVLTLFFLMGSASLILFSAFQKIYAGYPMKIEGFVVAFFFGGGSGLAVGFWRFLVKTRRELIQEIENRKRMEKALAENLRQSELIAENIPNIIWKANIDENGNFLNTYMSEAANELLVLPPGTMRNNWEKYFSYIEPLYMPQVMESFKSGIEYPGKNILCEYEVKNANGEKMWFASTGRVYNEKNKLKVYGSTIDITERKQAEDKIKSLLLEKEIILKEVHHRIKNNVTVMRNLFSLQSQLTDVPEVLSVFQDAISRLESMGVLYDKLYRTESYQDVSIKEYLSKLIDEIFGIFPDKQSVQIVKEIDDFVIGTKVIFPLGIIVNELLTNAMKYAFIDRDSGRIKISVAMKDNHVTLIFTDNGIGIPELINNKEQKKGFGLTLIDLLTEQIGGSNKIERNNGTRISIEFDV